MSGCFPAAHLNDPATVEHTVELQLLIVLMFVFFLVLKLHLVELQLLIVLMFVFFLVLKLYLVTGCMTSLIQQYVNKNLIPIENILAISGIYVTGCMTSLIQQYVNKNLIPIENILVISGIYIGYH